MEKVEIWDISRFIPGDQTQQFVFYISAACFNKSSFDRISETHTSKLLTDFRSHMVIYELLHVGRFR